jgi:hypothetical protein
MQDVLEEFEKQTELKFRRLAGVSGNTAVTYSAKEKPLKNVLDEIFKPMGLGYVIHRKENASDRYEGYIDVLQGDQRGDDMPKKDAKADSKKPAKPEPKKPAKSDKGEATTGGEAEKNAEPEKKPAADPDRNEKAAASKLKTAKQFLEDKMNQDAIEYLEDIVKKYGDTKAAAEAKELLAKLKKKS